MTLREYLKQWKPETNDQLAAHNANSRPGIISIPGITNEGGFPVMFFITKNHRIYEFHYECEETVTRAKTTVTDPVYEAAGATPGHTLSFGLRIAAERFLSL